MAKYDFNDSSVAKLNRILKKIDGVRGVGVTNSPEQIVISPKPGARGAPPQGFPPTLTAQLTSKDSSNPIYAWTQATRTKTAWMNTPGGATGTLLNMPAFDLDPSSTNDLTNKYIVLAPSKYQDANGIFQLGWIIVGVIASGTISPIKTLSPGSGTTAATDTWSRTSDKKAVTLDMQTREYWDGTGNVLYYFTRLLTWDSAGELYSISAETQHTTDTTVPC